MSLEIPSGRHARDDATSEPGILLWAGIHDALSSRIAEATGFHGLWLGSYALSASRLGMADGGHLTPATAMQTARQITNRTTLPMTIDIENGYGLSPGQLLDEVSAFGLGERNRVCLEDTIGPKQCSLWADLNRILRPIDEMAALLAQLVEAFGPTNVLGRTESLIENLGVDEAVRRVRVYAAVGCWGVVVHFRAADQLPALFEVAQRVGDGTRLVVIPTAAPTVPIAEFARRGFSVYVAAHVGIRATVTAIQRSFTLVHQHRRLQEALDGAITLEELEGLLDRDA